MSVMSGYPGGCATPYGEHMTDANSPASPPLMCVLELDIYTHTHIVIHMPYTNVMTRVLSWLNTLQTLSLSLVDDDADGDGDGCGDGDGDGDGDGNGDGDGDGFC